MLDNEALKVGLNRNKRETLRSMLSQTAISERLVSLNSATMQCQSIQGTEMVQCIKAIAFERRRFGYFSFYVERDSMLNHKKVYRLYREGGLAGGT